MSNLSSDNETGDTKCLLCSVDLDDNGCGLSCLNCSLLTSNDCCEDNNVVILALAYSHHSDTDTGYDDNPYLVAIPKETTIKVENQEVNIYDTFLEDGPFSFDNELDAQSLKLYRNKDPKPYLYIDKEILESDFYDGTGLMWQCQTCGHIYYTATD
jgi:hypothetical protein